MSEKPQTGPNIKRLAAHIEKHTDHIHWAAPEGGFKVRDYEAEARWYIAYNNAMDMNETYRTKDWAYCVLDGMQPLSDEDVGYYCHYIGNKEEQECWAGEPTRDELVRWFHG